MATDTPKLKISLSLSSSTLTHGTHYSLCPVLTVTTILLSPPILTLETRGEHDSGSCLGPIFRGEHLSFIDKSTGEEIVNPDPFPGTCDPGDSLFKDVVLELKAGEKHVVEKILEDVSPLADPVRLLRNGREYGIRLKTQRVRGWQMGVEELFAGRDSVADGELPEAVEVVLESEDEVGLKVAEESIPPERRRRGS